MGNEAQAGRISRRSFIKTSAAVSAAMAAPSGNIFAAGSGKVRVGLVGCGSRGTGAAMNCLDADPAVELVAMADVFDDMLQGSLNRIKKKYGKRVKVTPETSFLGFDAYKKLIDCDLDIVMLCTPPGFRPMHVRAAVEAGKNLFVEKPGAVDPVGVRSLLKSAAMADEKGLSIVVGTQQRWQPQYREIMRRIHDGELGELVGGQAYWHWGQSKWHWQPRKPEWSDMEWQIRCWPCFTWLSGDHYVEQHFHNMDVINWAMGSPPVQCLGVGGRQARTGPEFGNIFDHFAVEFEYPGGIRVLSMASQIAGSTSKWEERIVCTKGRTCTTRRFGYIEGPNAWKYDGPNYSGMVKEHQGLIAAIRDGKPLNECKRLAETTLTMVMGRMSAYTGRALKWEWALKASKLDLSPEKYELGTLPVRPVAIPGKTKLV